MEKYSNIDPKILKAHENLQKWIKSNVSVWLPDIEKNKTGVRALQTFFESPQELFSGRINFQSLREHDLDMMYKNFKEDTLNIKSPHFVWFFYCRDAVRPGEGLTIMTYINTNIS